MNDKEAARFALPDKPLHELIVDAGSTWYVKDVAEALLIHAEASCGKVNVGSEIPTLVQVISAPGHLVFRIKLAAVYILFASAQRTLLGTTQQVTRRSRLRLQSAKIVSNSRGMLKLLLLRTLRAVSRLVLRLLDTHSSTYTHKVGPGRRKTVSGKTVSGRIKAM